MLHSIHFSLDEANVILKELKPMISEMSELKKTLDDKNYDVYRHEYFGGLGPNGDGTFPQEMEKLIDIIKTISVKGVLIKGINNGLIDFPYIRNNGEEVYLCWMLGEEQINFWHRIPEGFPGRKNIDEL